MKRSLFIARLSLLLMWVLAAFQPLAAQQNQELQRSKSIFAFPEFQDAKVRQSFGRFAKAKANIYLKDASLVYMQAGKIMRAYTKGIYGVIFNDSIEYVKVDSAMCRIVAKQGNNALLCKTTVNMRRYREEESGTVGMDFFELPDNDVFMQLDGEKRDEDLGIPLQNKYFFRSKGFIIPANETDFKKSMDQEQMEAFKVLMTNRFWSWKDPESLKMLLDFLPQ